jgi:uncharacterized protein (TIGR00297 family)
MASPRVIERVLTGFVIALAIALAAYRAGSLSRSGAAAATLVGTASVVAGWSWGILLVAYFVASSLLSRFRRAEKERITGAIVEKGGARDAMQVIANGGVFAAGALVSALAGPATAMCAGIIALGALAAATADTWATEVGTLFGGIPRSLLTFRRVPPGTSGAVSVAGCAAMLLGAAFIAYFSSALGLTLIPPLVLVAGVVGALGDSILGATLQERRWCASCERSTERRIHDCGTATARSGGAWWMNNDGVNLIATIVGGAVAALGLIV